MSNQLQIEKTPLAPNSTAGEAIPKLMSLRILINKMYADSKNIEILTNGIKNREEQVGLKEQAFINQKNASISDLQNKYGKQHYQEKYNNTVYASKYKTKRAIIGTLTILCIVAGVLAFIIVTALLFSSKIPIMFGIFGDDGYFAIDLDNRNPLMDILLCLTTSLICTVGAVVSAALISILVIAPLIKTISTSRNVAVRIEEKMFFKKGGTHDSIVAKMNKEIKDQENILKNNIATLDSQKNAIISEKNKLQKTVKSLKLEYAVACNLNYINPSDFAHIDFIIFLFVSKRAETLKEALQLLDHSRQTGAIIQAIGTSTQYLATNISATINSMQHNIIKELHIVNETLKKEGERTRQSIEAAAYSVSLSIDLAAEKISMAMNDFQKDSSEQMDKILSKINEFERL